MEGTDATTEKFRLSGTATYMMQIKKPRIIPGL